jgi:hypothetical protein
VEAKTPEHGHRNVYEEMYLEEERVRGRRAVGICFAYQKKTSDVYFNGGHTCLRSVCL